MISLRRGVTVIFTVLVVAGMVVPGTAVAAHNSSDPPSDIPDSQLFELTDDGQVSAWERAAYPLRIDDTDAATQVPVSDTVQGERLGDGNSFTDGNDGVDSKSLVREFDDEANPMGVHTAGEDVRISYDANFASAGSYDQLDGQDNVELVAARLTPVEGAELPDDTDEMFDLLSDIDNANRNASFQILDNSAAIDSSGQLSRTEQFEPGNYVVFAVVNEPDHAGIETGATGAAGVAADNITVDGQITVIGMDQLTVQESETDVDVPPNANPGDTLTVDVDTTDAFDAADDGSVTHAVAVYNAETFEAARFDLVVDESALGEEFSLDSDAQLEHSIRSTNGVADVEDGTTLNGNDLADGEVRRPVDASAVIDFIAEDAGATDPSTHPITNGGEDPAEFEDIDASVTAVNGADRETTIEVDTFGNFSTGEYQYVVVSTLDDDESQVSTATGQLSLSAAGGGGGGGGVGTVVRTLTPAEQGGVGATVSSLASDQQLVLNVGPDRSERTAAVDQVRLTSPEDTADLTVRVTQSDSPGDGVPANPRGDSTVSYVNVETENLPNEDEARGSVSFTVSDERLDELNASPEDVQLYRYDESWEAVETTYEGDNRYEGATPGFSWFAIGVDGATPATVNQATLTTETVSANTATDVSAVVRNNGTTAQNVTLSVTADGESVETRTVTVDGNSTATETFAVTLTEPGSYDIAVNGVDAGTLTVTGDAATPTALPTDATDDGPAFEPGGIQPFTILIALTLVLVAVVLAFAYRRKGS